MDKVNKGSIKWLKSKKTLAVLFVFKIIILGFTIGWFITQNTWLEKDYEKQRHLSLQEDKFDELYRHIQKAEAGIRGYAVTAKKSYIKNTEPLLDTIQSEYEALKNSLLKKSESAALNLFTEFDTLINAKISFMRQAKKLCDEDDCAGALQLIATEKGILLTSAILNNIESLNAVLENSLLESKERFSKVNTRNNYIAYFGIFLALSLLWIFIWMLRKENQRSRKISEELRLHKEHFNVALNSISEGLITTGSTGKIKFMNSSAERLTGWRNEDAVDKPLQHIYNVVNEETGLPFENVAERIIKEGKVIELENNTILRTKDNKEIIISNNGSPLLDNQGKIAGSVVVFNDITGKKNYEQELENSNERFKNLIQHLPEAVYTCDEKGYIQVYNKAAELLWGRKPVPGKDKWNGAYKLLNTDGSILNFEDAPIAASIQQQKPGYGKELIIKREDGSTRHVLSSPAPIFNVAGQLTGAVNILIDITAKKEREVLIQKTEEKYKNLIEQATDAIVVYSMDGKIYEYNNILCTMTGYTREEFSNLRIMDFLKGPMIEDENRHASILAGEMSTQNRQIRTKEGELIDLEVKIKMIEPGKFLAIARDVTERKKAEVALKKSFEVQKLIMDTALDAIVCIDLRGMITFWNPVAEKIFGWHIDEVLGKTLSETIIPEKYREKHREGMKRYLETGVAQVLNKTIEITALNKEGKEFPVDLSIVSVQQSDDPFFCAFIRDITKRKEAEIELNRLKENYLTLINSIDGIVWEADAKTFQFSFVSEQANRLLGYPPELWINQASFWADHIYKEDRNWAIEYCISCTREKMAHDFEYRMVAADGRIVWLRDMVSVQVENDEPAKLIGIMVDITSQKQTVNEIREKNEQLRMLSDHLQKIREEERTNMAREIHDELGQQLTIMKMDISWLQDNVTKENCAIQQRTAELKNMLDQTVTTVRRLAHELRPSMLDDMGLVAAIEWHLAEFEKRAGIKTEYSGVKNQLPLTDAAKTGLFRIIQESLTNVARYANAKKVKVNLRQVDDKIVLKIVDDGIGFEPEKLAFKKTLGIIGMKERCIMLGGEFKIETAIGSGTKIKVTVPAQDETR